MTQTSNKPSNATNLTLKGVITGVLILAIMIPAVLVQELIEERRGRQDEVIQEVSNQISVFLFAFVCAPEGTPHTKAF